MYSNFSEHIFINIVVNNGKYTELNGFRHTIISQLIKNGADRYEVMKYTGHTTLSAFEKYIKSIFAEPPKDLSDKITVII